MAKQPGGDFFASRRFLAAALSVGAGAATATSSCVNALLAANIDSSVIAANISISLSAAYLLASLVLLPPQQPASWSEVRPWMFGSALSTPLYVYALTALAPLVGVQTLFTGVNTGQLISAALLDHTAFAGMPRRRVTAARAVGAALPIGACVLLQQRATPSAGSSSSATADGHMDVMWAVRLALCVLAGCALPMQAALNTRLARHVGGARVAGSLVCSVGAVLMAAISLGACASGALPPPADGWVARLLSLQVPPWQSLCGRCARGIERDLT